MICKMKPTKEEVNRLIDMYGFTLPEEDPEGGGFVCEYFPELEENHELQEKILSCHQEILEELQRRRKEEQTRTLLGKLRRIK